MQVRSLRGLKKLVKRFPQGENPEYRHQKTSVGDLVERLEHFIIFWH